MLSLLYSTLVGRPKELDPFAEFFGKYVDFVKNKEQFDKDHATVLAMYDMLQVREGI